MLKNLTAVLLRRKAQIVSALSWIFILIALLTWLGGCLIVIAHPLAVPLYELGTNLGKIALIVYSATLIPGIARRFGVNHSILIILTAYRRQLGILTYLLAFTHYFWIRGVFTVVALEIFLPPYFEMAGIFALFLLTPLFITSNDFALTKLGKWWKRLHRLTYIALALVFVHTALQDLSFWSVLAGTILTLEVVSWLYVLLKKKPSNPEK